MTDLLEYIRSSLLRAEAGQLDSEEGSHLSGVFGRATKRFENAVKTWIEGLLLGSGIDYDAKLRHKVRAVLPADAWRSRLRFARGREPAKCPWKAGVHTGLRLLSTFTEINKTWVRIKHGDEPPKSELVNRPRSMERAVTQIRKQS